MPNPAGVHHVVFPYGLGFFLAAALSYAASRMRSDERWLLTWVMGLVLIGFIGFPMSAGDMDGVVAEALVLAVLGPALVWSWVRRNAVLLAAVYFLHGLSDAVHLLGTVSPANPDWLHEFCIPFDGLICLHILRRRSHFRDGRD